MPFARRGVLTGIAATLACPAVATSTVVPPPVRTRFGMNYARLFLGQLNGDLADANAGLAALGRRGVPFVRFPASGQWAGDWARLAADPASYWAIMDGIFSAAEGTGVQLIPSVLWNAAALAMHCGEAMRAWCDTASKTRRIADSYAATFVERYDHSPALLMYEFTNELNDWVDLPAPVLNRYWPKTDPTLPGRKPTPEDRLTSEDLLAVGEAFAGIVRQRSGRPISMGTNTPRANAWHLAHGAWDKDSPAQFARQLRHITPARMNVLSIHAYANDWEAPGSIFTDLSSLLAAFTAAAAVDGRITLVGEFGVPRTANRDRERQHFVDMVATIAQSGIDYAAVWNYAPNGFQPEWGDTISGDRSYQIDEIMAHI